MQPVPPAQTRPWSLAAINDLLFALATRIRYSIGVLKIAVSLEINK
jgi:hypothetical protein